MDYFCDLDTKLAFQTNRKTCFKVRMDGFQNDRIGMP